MGKVKHKPLREEDTRMREAFEKGCEPILKRHLRPFKLHRVTHFATAYGCTLGYASRLLNGGERFGMHTAMRIAKLVDLPWHVIVGWQGDGKHEQ